MYGISSIIINFLTLIASFRTICVPSQKKKLVKLLNHQSLIEVIFSSHDENTFNFSERILLALRKYPKLLKNLMADNNVSTKIESYELAENAF